MPFLNFSSFMFGGLETASRDRSDAVLGAAVLVMVVATVTSLFAFNLVGAMMM